MLLETTRYENDRRGDSVHFEELFTLNENGKPVRKDGSRVQFGNSDRR